jgi:hypothetical protein
LGAHPDQGRGLTYSELIRQVQAEVVAVKRSRAQDQRKAAEGH